MLALFGLPMFLRGAPARAGFSFGMGQAAAKKAKVVVDKAAIASAAAGNSPSTAGNQPSVVDSLPSCNLTGPLSVLPIDLSSVTAIYPLGNLSPPPHTFPADHHDIYTNKTIPGDPSSPAVWADILSPGLITVTDIASTEYLSALPPFTDYAIYFYPCRELRMYVGHVRTLSPGLAAAAGNLGNCFNYISGGSSIRRCDQNTNIPMNPGDQIGTAPGMDFGAYDTRTTPLAFISPQRQAMYKLNTVCPSDYFTPALKAAMNAKTGRYDGLQWRTDNPVCGQILYDVPNSAQGEWFNLGAPYISEEPNLALVHNPVTFALEAISAGSSTPDITGVYYFVPAASGFLNRDFADVRSDGNVYCYDSFQDSLGGSTGGGAIILDMPTPSTLRIEKYIPGACGSGPWAMTGAAVEFQR